ncbi:MAG: OmpA family protein [Bryobacteraceae bacterium]
MIRNHRRLTWLLLAFTLLLFAAGCKKKVPPPPPPPPAPVVKETPPAPKPSARVTNFTVEPSTIQRGQSATLRWAVENADSVTIEPGIGTVPATGSRQIYPNETTNYTLTAKGPGGNDARTARVTVTDPPAPPAPAPPPQPTETLVQMLERTVQDVYFDYDQYDIREDARSTLSRDSDALKEIFRKFPNAVILVEGHCDERGSAEYNLGLGDRRSSSARDFLVQLGVSGDKLRTVSYGKERPQCTDATEDCWQRNRRAHFSVGQ